MKIESSLISYQEKNKRLVSNQENFEQWLNEAPSQQLKDYYRNHLSQLEPSALCFDRMTDPSDTTALSLAKNTPFVSNRPTKVHPDLSVSLNKQSNEKDIMLSPHSCTHPISPPILQIKPTYATEKVAYRSESAPLAKQDNEKNDASSIIKYKVMLHETPNFHLFTEGQQIELALNTHNMPSHERHDLLQNLKLFFKKKGLLLKKLLLNGVTHDHTH